MKSHLISIINQLGKTKLYNAEVRIHNETETQADIDILDKAAALFHEKTGKNLENDLYAEFLELLGLEELTR